MSEPLEESLDNVEAIAAMRDLGMSWAAITAYLRQYATPVAYQVARVFKRR